MAQLVALFKPQLIKIEGLETPVYLSFSISISFSFNDSCQIFGGNYMRGE